MLALAAAAMSRVEVRRRKPSGRRAGARRGSAPPASARQVIEKRRHHVRHAGYLYEIDVFAGRLDGLIVAELETADQVPADRLPAWIGRELTGDMRYSNAMLALGDVPQPVLQALSA
jgi:hypothetical protein